MASSSSPLLFSIEKQHPIVSILFVPLGLLILHDKCAINVEMTIMCTCAIFFFLFWRGGKPECVIRGGEGGAKRNSRLIGALVYFCFPSPPVSSSLSPLLFPSWDT